MGFVAGNYGMLGAALLRTLRSFAERIDPADAGAHNNLGVFYYRRGLADEAAVMFRRALELDPGLDTARANLAFLQGEGDAAPRMTGVPAVEAAESSAARRVASRPNWSNRPNPLVRRAHELRRAAESNQAAGRVAEAIASYRHALALDPGDATSRFNLALLLAGRNAFTAALTPLLELLDEDPYNVPALAALGAVLEGLDRLPDATVAFTRVMRLDPRHEAAAAYFRRRQGPTRNLS